MRLLPLLMVTIMLSAPIVPAFAVAEVLPDAPANNYQFEEEPSLLEKGIDKALIALYLKDPPLETLGPEYAESLREISELNENIKRTTPMLEHVLNSSIESIELGATEIADAELEFAGNILDSMELGLEEADVDFKLSGDEVTKKLKKARKKEMAGKHEDFITNATAANAELSDRLEDVSESVENAREAIAANDTAAALLELTTARDRLNNLETTVEETKKKPHEEEEEFDDDLPTRPSEGNRTKPRMYFPKEEPHADIYETLPEEEKSLLKRIVDEFNFISDVFAQEAPTPPPYEVSEEVANLSNQLDNNPAKIYAYVRDEVEYTPYYGYMKGSLWTMWEGAGNDFDQAALLSDLLRAAGYETRFVIGTVEVEPAYMRQVLGVNTTEEALQLLWENYVPAEIENRKILIEHVWVEAYIPYSDYRGFVMNRESASGWHWMPMDAAFVPYRAKDPYPVTGVGFDVDLAISKLTQNVTSNGNWFTGLNYSAMEEQIDSFYNETHYDYIYEIDAKGLGGKSIFTDDKKTPDIIPGTTPFEVLTFEKYSSIPEEFKTTVEISLKNGAGTVVNVSLYLAEINTKQLMLIFEPTSQEDIELINGFGSFLDTPAYMLDVRAQLWLGDDIVSLSSEALTLGESLDLKYEIQTPSGVESVSSTIQATGYYALVSVTGSVPYQFLEDQVSSSRNIFLYPTDNIAIKDVLGDTLYLLGSSYFSILDMYYDGAARQNNIRIWRPTPGFAIVSYTPQLEYVGSVPTNLVPSQPQIDVQRNMFSIKSFNPNITEKSFLSYVASLSSDFEGSMFGFFNGTRGISASRIIRDANDQNIPIYIVTDQNLNQVLPDLYVSDNVKERIKNAVNRDFAVMIPKHEMTYGNWTGSGWVEFDPETNAAGYMMTNDLGAIIHGGVPEGDTGLEGFLMQNYESTTFTGFKSSGTNNAVKGWGTTTTRTYDASGNLVCTVSSTTKDAGIYGFNAGVDASVGYTGGVMGAIPRGVYEATQQAGEWYEAAGMARLRMLESPTDLDAVNNYKNAMSKSANQRAIAEELLDIQKVGKKVKLGARSFIGTQIVVETAYTGYNVKKLQDEGKYNEAGHEILAGGGRLAGGILGATAGAEAGAILGTAIAPGLGTVIGAGVGAVVGGIAGALTGEKFMRSQVQQIERVVDTVTTKVGEAISRVTSWF